MEKFWLEKSVDTTVRQNMDKNKNYTYPKSILVDPSREISQPYWMVDKMVDGSFTVNNQNLV
ncbi:MAG: hypothetical protein IPP79_24315 [Chitinophagaceae bacterium]|nr:hypothetical protein [Chitinophagaceae bacterium]